MQITHALTLDDRLTIEYSGTPNLFYLTAGDIVLVLTQNNRETIYNETFGALMHSYEKTGA